VNPHAKNRRVSSERLPLRRWDQRFESLFLQHGVCCEPNFFVKRCSTLLEELAEQAFGGFLVAPALDENIENEAVLVNGSPEPMLLPGEADDNLIEVPFVATARRSPTDAVGEFPAEFEAPLPDRLVRQARRDVG
jgi:hypothetical protein